MDKIARMIANPNIMSSVPEEFIAMKHSGELHKLAAARVGVSPTSYELRDAIYGMAKKAYIMRNQWKLISNGLQSYKDIEKDVK